MLNKALIIELVQSTQTLTQPLIVICIDKKIVFKFIILLHALNEIETCNYEQPDFCP